MKVALHELCTTKLPLPIWDFTAKKKGEFPKDRIPNLNLPSVILKGWSLVLKPQT